MTDIKKALAQLHININSEEEKYIFNDYNEFKKNIDLIAQFDIEKYNHFFKEHIVYGKILTLKEFETIQYETNNLFNNSNNYVDGKIEINNEK